MSQGRTTAAASLERLFNLAVRLQQSGRVREAADHYERVLRQAPDHLGSLQLLGIIHAQHGRPERALDLLKRALERHPSASDVHNNIGMILHALKRDAEAVAHYETALAINPRYAIACNNLGIALEALGRRDEAIVRYRQALALQPGYPEALNNLGTAMQATQQYAEAAEQFRAALALRPEFHDARMNLGTALDALRRPEEAIAEYRTVLRIQPDHAVAHLNLARLLHRLGRHADALPHYTRARDLKPGNAAAQVGLGVALQEIGRLGEARQCFERAIEIEPRRAQHYANLASTTRMTRDDPHLAAMLALAEDMPSLAEEEQVQLDFALGKALAETGEPERSFRHLLRANALKRRHIAYDEAAMIGTVERARDVFTPELMRRLAGLGDPSPAPVFIVGMPRSGSTLVEQILASHPRVFAAGEVMTFRQAMREAGVHGKAGHGKAGHGKTRRFPDTVPDLTGEQLGDVAARYLAAMQAMVPDADRARVQRITNKLLDNFRCVGLIHLALPNARIIHTVRDPIDTCLSCFSLDFLNHPQMYELGELGRFYRAYAELMRHWRGILPPGVMLDVQYEDLVADFEPNARRIVAHCGLDWDPACLAFHETERPVKTLSFAQVRRPLYRSSVGRWRPDAETLRPLLDAIGETAA